MEFLPKNLSKSQKNELPNPLSNPESDDQERSYQRITESARKIVEKSKSWVTIV
jgi:hypothetical protein